MSIAHPQPEDTSTLKNWIPLEAIPSFGQGRSFVAGEPGGDRFRVRYFQYRDSNILGGLVWFGPGTEGGPSIVHGGAVSSILDEALGRSAWLSGQIVVTANLSVNYRLAVPLLTQAKVLAWVSRVEGRKVYTRGRLIGPDGELLADAEALFIRVSDERFKGKARDIAAKLSSHFAVEPVESVPRKPKTITFEGADGNAMVADTWGDPEWKPIVFLHGGGQTRHSWGGTARTMAEHGWYAICLDARGHGDSDWSPEGRYLTEHFVADLNAVLSTLTQPAALVGASLGGITSLVGVGAGSVRDCRGLVLVDITPKMESGGVERIRGFMLANLDGFATVEDAADAVAAYRRHRSRPKDVTGLKKNLRFRNGRYYWHWDPKFITIQREGPEEWERMLRKAAQGIRVPTLLVRGASSDVVSEEGAKQFLEDVPGAQYVDVKGAGHMVAGDRNDVFSEAVIKFLQTSFTERSQ